MHITSSVIRTYLRCIVFYNSEIRVLNKQKLKRVRGYRNAVLKIKNGRNRKQTEKCRTYRRNMNLLNGIRMKQWHTVAVGRTIQRRIHNIRDDKRDKHGRERLKTSYISQIIKNVKNLTYNSE